MKVIFIRHGESEDNAKGIHQSSEGGLSEHGKAQAAYVARSLRRFPIENILASPFKRTQETAEIINTTLQKPLEYTKLLQEVVRPSELHGRHHQDPESMRVKQLIKAHMHDPDWHYSDEENFYDTASRARQFLETINNNPHEYCLVVTHAAFLKVIIAVMQFKDALTPALQYSVYEFFHTMNTGITIVEQDKTAQWQLMTWNDYAHLHEIV